MEQYRQHELRRDRRAALAAWVLMEVHRNREARAEPFTLEEVVAWLGHGFQPPRPRTPPPTPDALAERAQAFMELLGARKRPGMMEGLADGLPPADQ